MKYITLRIGGQPKLITLLKIKFVAYSVESHTLHKNDRTSDRMEAKPRTVLPCLYSPCFGVGELIHVFLKFISVATHNTRCSNDANGPSDLILCEMM